MSSTNSPEKDHMGRLVVDTKMAAFHQDLPWIIGCIGVLVFLGLALAGFFRF